jgi:hypothetical protein
MFLGKYLVDGWRPDRRTIAYHLWTLTAIGLFLHSQSRMMCFLTGPSSAIALLATFVGRTPAASRPKFQAVGKLLGLVAFGTLSIFGAIECYFTFNPLLVPMTAALPGLIGLMIAAAAVSLLIFTVTDPARRAGRLPYVAAITLLLATAWRWDHRDHWQRFVASDTPPASLLAALPTDGQIFWDGDVRVPWFLLKRTSYFSCGQGTGALFFRELALEYERRSKIIAPLDARQFGSEQMCPAVPTTTPLTAATILSVCAEAPELSAIVLTQPVAGAESTSWEAPAEFRDLRVTDMGVRSLTTRTFFIFRCKNKFRDRS